MSEPRKIRAGLVRPRHVLVDAKGETIGVVVSTATPSPLKYDKDSSVTYEGGDGPQTIDLPSGTYVWVRDALQVEESGK